MFKNTKIDHLFTETNILDSSIFMNTNSPNEIISINTITERNLTDLIFKVKNKDVNVTFRQ